MTRHDQRAALRHVLWDIVRDDLPPLITNLKAILDK